MRLVLTDKEKELYDILMTVYYNSLYYKNSLVVKGRKRRVIKPEDISDVETYLNITVR